MKLLYIVLVMFLQTVTALAETSTSLVMGQGINKADQSAIYLIRTEKRVDDLRRYGVRLDIGAWSESHPTRSPAFLTSVAVGRHIGDDKSVHGSVYMGVMFQTSVDTVLSTPFEFTEDANICYDSVCAGYKHVSNAGIRHPNIGRDYLTVSFGLGI